MSQDVANAFPHVPRTARGHYVLCLYAAVFHLLNHVRQCAELGGEPLDGLLGRYPFLKGYLTEMQKHMPQELTWREASAWWQAEIVQWEAGCECHLPLRAVSDELGLGFRGGLAFMLGGVVDEDSRFGTVFAEFQAPLAQRRPTVELMGQVLLGEADTMEEDAWTICRPLFTSGLVQALNAQVPRAEWQIRVPPLVWDAARGQVDPHPTPWACHRGMDEFPEIDQLIFPKSLIGRLRNVPALLGAGKTNALVLRSAPGVDALELAGTICRCLKRAAMEVIHPLAVEPSDLSLLGPLCTLANAVPVLKYELGPGETVTPPALSGYAGPLVLLLGHEGGLSGPITEKSVTLSLPRADASLRERHWQGALPKRTIEDLPGVVQRFRLDGGYIRLLAPIAVAEAGLDGRKTVQVSDVRAAARVLNRQLLDTLADPLDTSGSSNTLIAASSTMEKMRELTRRCRYREGLLAELGPAFRKNANTGVRALLTGASGTGKTLAARTLAAELGMDLYRVDLASIINKYIGETEKNLHRVLSRAEALDVVLLLDEGDALLGQRTDIKSANDRYANLETNYLLQRLENYEGIVLVTTNLGDNIDSAFQRRMDVVVPFFAPNVEERWRIMQLHLPEVHAVDPRFLETVAARCKLTGGQIRNACLHATLLALDDEASSLDGRHLEQALRSEYRKAGSTFPLNASKGRIDLDGELNSFIAALERPRSGTS